MKNSAIKNFPKHFARIFLLLVLVFSLSVFACAQIAFADPPGTADSSSSVLEDAFRRSEAELSRPGNDPVRDIDNPGGWTAPSSSTESPSSSDSAAGSSAQTPQPPSIDSKFDVNQLLAPGQTSRVPAAADTQPGPKGAVKLVVDIIDLMIKFIGGIALVIFIIGALLAIISQGKEDLLEKGKTAMVYSIIGLVVAFFSYIIVTFVQSIFY